MNKSDETLKILIEVLESEEEKREDLASFIDDSSFHLTGMDILKMHHDEELILFSNVSNSNSGSSDKHLNFHINH